MEMVINNLKSLDVGFIISHGKKTSSQEILEHVSPINWSEKTLSGEYKGKAIIKTNDKEDI